MIERKKLIRDIIKSSIVAALYFALVQIFAFMSYKTPQVRVAEVLVLLCFYDRKYTYGLVLGCFLANLLGDFGIIDAFIGSFATLIACLLVSLPKKLWVASLALPLANIIVGIEIAYIDGLFHNGQYGAIFAIIGMVMLGEFIAGTLLGVPLFKILEKRPAIIELIKY